MQNEAQLWEVVGPAGVFRQDFTTEAAAKSEAKRLNAPRFGNPARHWSRRYIARPVGSPVCAMGY